MKLVRLILDERQAGMRPAGWLIVAGLVRSAALPLVNWAVLEPRPATTLVAVGLIYVGVLALAVRAERDASASVIRIAQDVVHRLRMRVVTTLRQADPIRVEARGDALARLTRDLNRLTSFPRMALNMASKLTVLLGYAIYALSLSGVGFACWAGAIAYMVRDNRRRAITLTEQRRHLDRTTTAFDGRLRHFLRGFAQLRLSRAAMGGVTAQAIDARAEVERAARAVNRTDRDVNLRARFVPLAAIGVIAFALPRHVELGADTVFQFVTLFFVSRGAITALVRLDRFTDAEVAYQNILDLEADLSGGPAARSPAPARFGEITVERVAFRYPGGFAVGPIDLTLRPGQITLVTGGNGSGKTTLMKLLAGLYRPAGGRIRVDGRSVSPDALRALFTVCFADSHLFRRAYGLDVDRARFDALLDRLNLTGITDLDGDVFTRLDLSSGQRRRLALICALLEDRPVLVLDEWDAHQDPEATRWYYETLLPELARQGRVVVAVSHDDRYFNVADQHIRLAGGRRVTEPSPAAPG